MFDIGFSEIALIGVVALVVLGPERLPKVARTAGHLFGRLQRYVATVKADINREIEGSELAKVKQEVQDAARSFETTMRSETDAIEQQARVLTADVEKVAVIDSGTPPEVTPPLALSDAAAPALTQAQILAAQDESLLPTTPRAALPLLRFDLGIEPVRRIS